MPEFVAEAIVPADHPCLPGHFPDRPIVPAVLLLELVRDALRAHVGALRITAVRHAKFVSPVSPGETIRLQIAFDENTGRARFRCDVANRIAAQGELAYQR